MKLKQIYVAVAVAALLPAAAASAQTRAEGTVGDATGRDAVGFRKEKVTKETVGHMSASPNPLIKQQAIQDFREIQELNYKIRDSARASKLTLGDIEDTAKKIRDVAGRLKASLALPKPKEKIEIAPAQSEEELASQIVELNLTIKAFVTNPMFSSVNDASKDLPVEASLSLNKVIEMSRTLEQGAKRLRVAGARN